MNALVLLALVAAAPAPAAARSEATAAAAVSPAPVGSTRHAAPAVRPDGAAPAVAAVPVVGPESSAGEQPAAVTAVWGQPLTWSDGTRLRKAWADPSVVAEVGWDAAGAEAVRAVDPGAAVLAERPRVRLWTVRSAAELRRTLPAAVAPRFVAVWRDAPSAHAAERVAAGGLTVFFAKEQLPKDPAAWAAAHGLVVTQRLGARGLLVECPPGDEGLSRAAALSKEPGVSFAAPNWWRMGHSK